jgi:hypothetical protein
MAGTYGEPGKNEFQLGGTGSKYSIVVNPETKVSQIYERKSQFDFQSIGTLDLNTNKFTKDNTAPLSKEQQKKISASLDVFRRQSVVTATVGGATNAEELLLGNTDQTPPTQPPGEQPATDTSTTSGDGTTYSTAYNGTFDVTVNNFYGDNYSLGKLNSAKYPIDMNKNQDRVVIVQRKYVAPNVLEGGKVQANKIVQEFSRERFSTPTEHLGTVILPIPNDISETNVTAWGEDSLSSLAALVGGAAIGGVGKIAEGNIGGTIDDVMKAIGQLTTVGGSANQTIRQLLTLNAAAAITKKFGININPEAFRSRITGTAINPNLELLFQGPKLRSFGFQFKLTPRSQKEAAEIRKIIKFFKKGMAPKRNVTGGDSSYFLGAPNVFDIHFRSDAVESNGWDNDLKSIVKIKTCALQQCVVNYTPDGFYAAYNDPDVISQPIAVTIQLTFTELTPLYDDNYDGDKDSVGWDNIDFAGFAGESSTSTETGTATETGSAGPIQLPVFPSPQSLPPGTPGSLAQPAN